MGGVFAALGLLAIAVHAALAWTAPWSGSAGLFRALLLCAAAAAACPALLARRLPAGRSAAVFVVAVSAALHALWLPVEPTLSDDVRRYAFEGRLLRHGVSPYDAPPAAAPRIPGHSERSDPAVGHPELSSVYPPLSLLAFAVADLAGGIRGQKLLFGTASLAVSALLAWSLWRRRLPAARACLYAWSPLPAIEFAGHGHHDSLGLAALALAAVALAERRALAAAVAWGLAAAAKGISLVTLPAFWPEWRGGARAAALLVAAGGLLPLVWLSRGEHSGWLAYAWHWSHNSPPHALLAPWLGDGLLLRGVLAGLLLAGLWGLARLRLGLAAAAGSMTALALFLSPTVHPWYAAWALVWAPLAPSWGLWALGQTVLVTYALPGGQVTPGHGAVPVAWQLAEWGIPLGVALGELWWRGSAPERPSVAVENGS